MTTVDGTEERAVLPVNRDLANDVAGDGLRAPLDGEAGQAMREAARAQPAATRVCP